MCWREERGNEVCREEEEEHEKVRQVNDKKGGELET